MHGRMYHYLRMYLPRREWHYLEKMESDTTDDGDDAHERADLLHAGLKPRVWKCDIFGTIHYSPSPNMHSTRSPRAQTQHWGSAGQR